MDTKNLVSVVLPVYNREKYVKECINSVLKGSYQNFEIIIVDDGSTDKTYEICMTIAQKDSRIKLLQTEHVGVSAARNKALDNLKGEFVFFLDSDDIINPSLLEVLVNSMDESGAYIGATAVYSVSQKRWSDVTEKLNLNSKLSETVFKTSKEVHNALFCGQSPISCIGGVMMRKSLIGDTKFREDLYIGEDYYFIYQNVIKGATAVFLKEKWYYARMHVNNISWDYSFDGFWTRFYRRVLVWRNEELLGRKEYVKIQKSDAFFTCFNRCVSKNTPYSQNSKRMRKVLREYKKEIFYDLKFKGKLLFIMRMYFPFVSYLVFDLKKKKIKNPKK